MGHRRDRGIRTAVRAALAAGLLAASAAWPAPASAGAGDDPVVTSRIPYRTATTWDGRTVQLTLDRYQPPAGTPVRGALVWIHGGGFVDGSPRDPNDIAIATRLARHGYVTASIEYRLGPAGGSSAELEDPDVAGRIARAYEDTREAVRFVRLHADAWGFDPGLLYVGGASAGAGTALNVAYLPAHNTDRHAPYGVAGAVSLIGRTVPGPIEAGEPPMLMVNGTRDATVPLADARATCDAARRVGVACDFITYDMGHGDPALLEPIVADMLGWLDRRTAELAAEPDPSSTTTSTTTAPPSTTQPVTPPAAPAPAEPVAASPHLTG